MYKSDHEFYLVFQTENTVIKVYDGRTYDKNGRVKRGTPDYLNVTGVMDLEHFYEDIKKYIKTDSQSSRYFKELSSASDSYVEARKKYLGIIGEESVSNIYVIAKRLKAKMKSENKTEATPEDLTVDIFNAIADSYWMITKDIDWYERIGSKSLNKVAEYSLGNHKLEEYISNQVVKFSNPYMQGCKGAHVFVLKYGKQVIGCYTSRLSLKSITDNLVRIGQYDESNVKELMTNPNIIEEVDASMFFKFYDVLYNKDGWKFGDLESLSGYYLRNLGADFSISMYKPTGVMYLTVTKMQYIKVDGEVVGRKANVCPIFKIGDIDRALKVANTTNTGARETQCLKEMKRFASALFMESKGMCNNLSEEERKIYQNYIRVRELTLAGETRASEYEGLINDRILYMIGVKAKGTVGIYQGSREILEEDDYDFDLDDEEIEIEDDTYSNDEDIDIEDDDYEEDEYELEDDEYELEDENDELEEDEYELEDEQEDSEEEDDTIDEEMVKVIESQIKVRAMQKEEELGRKLTEEEAESLINEIMSELNK